MWSKFSTSRLTELNISKDDWRSISVADKRYIAITQNLLWQYLKHMDLVSIWLCGFNKTDKVLLRENFDDLIVSPSARSHHI